MMPIEADRLFDAHAHISLEPAAQPAAGRAAGRMLCAAREADWPAVTHACSLWPGSLPAYGVHPWYSGEISQGWPERLEQQLSAFDDAWVGECGLDRGHKGCPSLDLQTEVFACQLRLARRLGRRVCIHCHKAWELLPGVLDDCLLGAHPAVFLLHSFSGSRQDIPRLAERGAWFSIGPRIARQDTPKGRARVAQMPFERILVESDSPLAIYFDAAVDLYETAVWIAAVRGVSQDIMIRQLAENAKRMFGCA